VGVVIRRTLALGALLLVFAVTGCGTSNTSTTTRQTTTSTPAPKTHITVFRIVGGILHAQDVAVPKTQAVAGAALQALGIDAGVTIAGGTATVDLSSAGDDQVAEIVYTLTQFASVQRVDVAGHTALTRDDEAQFVPPILIESPADGAAVPATFTVRGSASVFEATLVLEVVAGGKTFVHQTVTASEGAPGRGTFSAALHVAATGPVKLVAYAPSAADGSPQHEVTEQLDVQG